MAIFSVFFANGPEYEARRKKAYRLPSSEITLKAIHSAVPQHLHKKSTIRGLSYVARDIFFAYLFYKLALRIDPLYYILVTRYNCSIYLAQILKWALWVTYWWWEGVVLAGWWCLAHEAGHGTISDHSTINLVTGFCLHTFLMVPYYSWRSTHHAHHKATGSVERDENYVPRTRTDYGLPAIEKAHKLDYHDILEETPIYTLFRMILMQLFGWQAYLMFNTLGSTMYPEGTNHFSPSSPLFKPEQRKQIVISNLGLSLMACILSYYTSQVGFANFLKFYFVPYLLSNHWIVMLTFLHHSDPTIPHYRGNKWSFLRGALTTVDRPLLGWVGRFFLHNVSHDHIAHHFFSGIPFYNQPQVTEFIKKILKEEYNYDSTYSFYALYRSFTECCFIEDEGDVVFYKNRKGEAQRQIAEDAFDTLEARE